MDINKIKISSRYIFSSSVVLLACILTFCNWELINIFNFNDSQSQKIIKTDSLTETLFTSEELSIYNGINTDNKLLYISILGKVYDVTKGAKHYGPGAPYYAFTGRDISRSFVTGEFTPDKMTDAVLDLPLTDLKSLNDWRLFYSGTYKYVGKLVGRFYNDDGFPTPYLLELENRFKEADQVDMHKLKLRYTYPPCNVQWDSEMGTRIWCTTQSGGITRDWVGVPRKLFEPGAKQPRCACVEPKYLMQGNLEEYANCPSDSTSCYVKTNSNKI